MGAFSEHMQMVRDSYSILQHLVVRGGRLLRSRDNRWVLDIKGGTGGSGDNKKSFAYAGEDNTEDALTITLREGCLQYGSDAAINVDESIIPIIPETSGPDDEITYIYRTLDLSDGVWSDWLGSSDDPQTYETDSVSVWTFQKITISFLATDTPGVYIAYISDHFTRHDGDVFEERV